MKTFNAGLTAITSALTAIAAVGWLGFQIKPKRIVPTAGEKRDFGRIAIPNDLPHPVLRYFETIASNQLPIVWTAVVWGRPKVRIGKFKFPTRFTSYINSGSDYLREIDVTWFGRPIMRVEDRYIGGIAATSIGEKVGEQSAELDQAGCLNLWAEALWTPSILLTDPRIRWEAIDDEAARLIVPFKDGEEQLLLSFDAQTGLISCLSGTRYKESAQKRVRWYCEPKQWQPYAGVSIPTKVAIRWEDDDAPWTEWEIDGILLNEDVSHKLPVAEPKPVKKPSSKPRKARERGVGGFARVGKRVQQQLNSRKLEKA